MKKSRGFGSILLGIVGVISLLLWWSYWSWKYFYNTPVGILENFLTRVGKIIYKFGFSRFYAEFAFTFVFFYSLVGLWLGFRGLKSLSKSFALSGIILNFINLLLSLFIAWLLFGLARGM